MKTVILCYHKVGFEPEEGRFLNCSPYQLASHAKFFNRKGWKGFLPRDFIEERKLGICFTFDDAYVSTVENAPDILERFGFRGSFYVVPSLVGLTSAWDGAIARPLAGWDDLLGIAARGHELGNHTLSHLRLDDLPVAGQERELLEASTLMRERGIDAQSVAFPYGAHNQGTFTAMEATGLKVGLALGKRPVGDEAAKCLPRIVVGYSDSVAKLLYKIYIRPKLP